MSADDCEAIAWCGARCEAAMKRGDERSAQFWSNLAFVACRNPGWIVAPMVRS